MFSNRQSQDDIAIVPILRAMLEKEQNRQCTACLNAHSEIDLLREVIQDMRLERGRLWAAFISSTNSALSRVGLDTIPILEKEPQETVGEIDLLTSIINAKVG